MDDIENLLNEASIEANNDSCINYLVENFSSKYKSEEEFNLALINAPKSYELLQNLIPCIDIHDKSKLLEISETIEPEEAYVFSNTYNDLIGKKTVESHTGIEHAAFLTAYSVIYKSLKDLNIV